MRKGERELPVVASAHFLIVGGDFEPTSISRALGRRPSQSWRKGELKSFRRVDGSIHYFKSRHARSGWKKWLTNSWRDKSLEAQLRYWVRLLGPKSAVLKQLRRRGLSLEINCCVIASTTAKFRAPAPLLECLGKWGIDVEFTWYSHKEKPSAG
jgi:hypothetical protein